MSNHDPVQADLLSLASMHEADIDTVDIPETTDFSSARRGRYYPLSQFGYDVRSIANWCVAKARSEKIAPSTMWLNKIVYFICEAAIRDIRALLTPARIEAWNHGPVFRELYFESEREISTPFKRFNPVTRQREVASESFDPRVLQLFDYVWREYAAKSPSELRNITHKKGSPWDKVWNNGGKEAPGMEISPLLILNVSSEINERS